MIWSILYTTTTVFFLEYHSINACKNLIAVAVEKESARGLPGLMALPELPREAGASWGGEDALKRNPDQSSIGAAPFGNLVPPKCGTYSVNGSSGSKVKKSNWSGTDGALPGGSGETGPAQQGVSKRGRRWIGLAVVMEWPPWGSRGDPGEGGAGGLPECVLLGWDVDVFGLSISAWLLEF